jgi:hypothetical protein
LNNSSRTSLFDGVVVTKFDILLGPTPAVVYPERFVAGEALRGIAEDAMLLLSLGRKEGLCSVMSFPQVGKIGVVGTESSTQGTAGIIVMFNGKAGGMVWETYPLIKSLIMGEFPNVRAHPGDAALRLYEGVRRVCEGSHEEPLIGETGDRLEEVVDKIQLAINSLLKSGSLDKLGSEESGTRARILKLLTVLQESRALLKY